MQGMDVWALEHSFKYLYSMSIEEQKQRAIEDATTNGGKLTRLPTGRWQGAKKFHDASCVALLVKEGKFAVSGQLEKTAAGGGRHNEVTLQ